MLETQVVGGVATRNPGRVGLRGRSNQTDEGARKHLTVGREVLIEQLLRSLATAREPGTARLHLLIGPAGIGKSHVLDCLDARIRQSPDIETRALVATLPEQTCPTSVVQLLARILRALPDDPELGPSIDALRSLQRQRDGDQEQRALELIELRLRGRHLFILLDRLDTVLEGLGAQGWARLRTILNAQTDWTLVTSTRDGVDAGEGFTMHELAPLRPDQCAELLARLARARGQVALADQLEGERGQARVHALHHMLGGTPGAMVCIADKLDPDRLDRIEDLLNELDEVLEPELRERTMRLSPGQRSIVELLVDSWRPLTVTEIAERAFAKQASTSGALRHLRREGLVRALELGRERYYELCDPLHRLARPHRGTQAFASVLRRWYAPARRAAREAPRSEAPLPELDEAELDEARTILGQSPAIAVGRLRGRLARSKSPVMSAALVLGLERGGRAREALDALAAVPPERSQATDRALVELADTLEVIEHSHAVSMVERILDAHLDAARPEARRALLDALDPASPAPARLLSDKLLRYPLLHAWVEVEAWSDLGQLFARLQLARTSPTLESELIAVIESAWHAQRLPELLGAAPKLDALLTIGSPRIRTLLAWARSLARLGSDHSVDEDELVDARPRLAELDELGPTGRALVLELFADPRCLESWSASTTNEDFVRTAQTALATGIYAWIASRRPLTALAELATQLREHSRIEVLPPALLTSKSAREAHARLAVSERALVREILALREPPPDRRAA